ncbi:MAG: hypothetical protein H6510_02320 [Acidobacteria bacterium]|nr:hypothetical protein [Acidobacteriota bacterium]
MKRIFIFIVLLVVSVWVLAGSCSAQATDCKKSCRAYASQPGYTTACIGSGSEATCAIMHDGEVWESRTVSCDPVAEQ